MRSSRIIDEKGRYVKLVTFDNSSEPYFIGTLKSQFDKWDTFTTDVLGLMSSGNIRSITITQEQASAMYGMFRNKIIMSRASGRYVSGNAVDAMAELFSHTVEISKTVDADNWTKRPLRVSAMKYDGSAESFDNARRFTSLTPIHRVRDRNNETGEAILPSLESDKILYPGDYIVRSIEGEFYPVREEVMEKSRRVVAKKKPYPDSLPWVRYWDNNPVAVLAHQYTGDNYDVILELCQKNGWLPPMEHDAYTGLMQLPKDNKPDASYIALPGDVILYEPGRTPRVCREDIFRNTYETVPEGI